MRSPSVLVHSLGIFSTLGDFRLLFLLRDRIARLDVSTVQQAAKRYLTRQNRTVAQFVPEELPPIKHARPPVDVAVMLQDFHGGATVQPGEPFAQTPAQIAKAHRFVVDGVKLGQRLATALTGGPRFAWLPYALLWLGLVTGAIIGATAFPMIGLAGLWFAAAIALGLAGAALLLVRSETR